VHRPVRLTVVTPPWNFPVAIPAGSTLAGLAAGSAVMIKAAPQARRCAAVMVEALHAAGIPTDVLRQVDVDEGEVGRALVADPRVDRLILTGAYETAELFRSFRPDLPLLAETSGKNAIVITPSADLDLAVRDVVSSAFGHAGQKCSAASLVILVGSVARSSRFRRQLADAVSSLTVGRPEDATSRMGPLIEPAAGKLLDALTGLEPGEAWLVPPRRLDDVGQLWSPGVKTGVRPGSPFHLIEYFGPVLGVMTAETLAQAVELQNAVEFGLTAGLHSLDEGELAFWLEHVEAGNLYVNRGITGAIVGRQPFGGWKRSAVGAGTKAGGPNYLIGLSNWSAAPATVAAPLSAAATRLLAAARAAGLPALAGLERGLGSDAAAWAAEFGVARDVSRLGVERNVLRYRPYPAQVLVRLGSGPAEELVRVVAAGLAAGVRPLVSTVHALPDPITAALEQVGVGVEVEDAAGFAVRLASLAGGRVRLIGADPSEVYRATDGRPDVAVYAQPVTEAGRVELLPFLREQAVSITAHRFGTPDRRFAHLIPVADTT
jgi:RHH-type proline utilization regulon transcriptional repressor/proline dehydrogenase/delta 1-pyrroline-5-carboxylate dehydrogenase